jgi:enoyl-CoA hydratase/carnithine racemase
MSDVIVERHDGWAEVILNRPAVRNAINGPLGIALAEAMRSVDQDDDVNVVLFRGAEGAFCSGLDLKSFNAEPAPDWLADFSTIWRGAHKALFECRKPIVGALERYAINGGAALALAADLLVAGEGAFLQVGEVQQGMAAPYNMAWLRLRHPEALASQIALIGRRYPGVELKDLGIACATAADDQVVTAATELTTQLAGYPRGALMKIKAGLRAYGPDSADEWFDLATSVDPVGRPAPRAVDPQ